MLINQITLAAAGVVLGMFPAVLTWLREKRLTNLSRARLDIAKAVTGIEELVRTRKIAVGHLAHDVLFPSMERAQLTHKYPVGWFIFKGVTSEQKAVAEALHEEIYSPDCLFRDCTMRFISGYYRAFRYQHPWVCRMHVIYHGTLFLAARGVLHTVTALLDLSSLLKDVKEYVREQYFAQSNGDLLPS